MTSIQKLGFYATPPHACNYLPDREAVTLFADPRFPKNSRLYSALADCGFRRSGEHLYTPHCDSCASCIPVRVPVNEFKRSRNQARNWKGNADLLVKQLPAEFSEEHFALYQRYLKFRHPDGGMDNPTPDSYMEFLTASWADTFFLEIRLGKTLVAVAVTDIMDNALSAIYTFFDPELEKRSLGRYAILYQIEQSRQRGFSWLYLGYWIKRCRKMSYKAEYQPLEYYVNNQWTRNRPFAVEISP